MSHLMWFLQAPSEALIMTAEGFYMSHARQICESLSPFQVSCCSCVFILEFTECVVTLSKKVMLITNYCVSTFMRQAGGTRSVVLGLKKQTGDYYVLGTGKTISSPVHKTT